MMWMFIPVEKHGKAPENAKISTTHWKPKDC